MENIPRISWLSSTLNLEGNYGRLYFSTSPKVVLECSLFKPKVLRRSLMYDIVYISNLPTFCFLSVGCSGTISPVFIAPFTKKVVQANYAQRKGTYFQWIVLGGHLHVMKVATFLGVSGSTWGSRGFPRGGWPYSIGMPSFDHGKKRKKSGPKSQNLEDLDHHPNQSL